MIERLLTAPFEFVGRFEDASNATLLVRLTDRDPRTLDELAADLGRPPRLEDLEPADLAVHKPEHGEAPLWDFPAGTLHRREVAAFEVSQALAWDLVPETVLRDDGPLGPGSLQRFVPHDPQLHYFSLLDGGDADVVEQLRAMVVFDLVIDNADRKGGHVMLEEVGDDRRVRLVDHGVSFHVERKLRTVAWDFAGEPVPPALARDVDRLVGEVEGGELGRTLHTLLTQDEVAMVAARCRAVASLDTLPGPSGRHPYPWPLL